jgi:hypothetical protein
LRQQLSQVLEQNRLGSDNAIACFIQFLEFDIWMFRVLGSQGLSMSKLDPVHFNAPGNIKCAHGLGIDQPNIEINASVGTVKERLLNSANLSLEESTSTTNSSTIKSFTK